MKNWKRWLLWALRIGGTAVGFGYIASIVEVDQFFDAMTRVSIWAFVAACLATVTNISVGAIRWRILLGAYAATHRPGILRLIHIYWVGFFYNTYLPGGVGGDVVRGLVTRQSFGERGAAASVTVVLVERVLGLSGLLILVTVTYLIEPIPGTENVLSLSALGLLAAAVAVTGVAVGRNMADKLPGRLAAIARKLPKLERPAPFAAALALSLITQALVAITGWFFLASITDGAVTIAQAFVLVPLAMAAAFFPFSVGGAGVREAVFVTLCWAALQMPESEAMAVSLAVWGTQLFVAGFGGLALLVSPLDTERASKGGDDSSAAEEPEEEEALEA